MRKAAFGSTAIGSRWTWSISIRLTSLIRRCLEILMAMIARVGTALFSADGRAALPGRGVRAMKPASEWLIALDGCTSSEELDMIRAIQVADAESQ